MIMEMSKKRGEESWKTFVKRQDLIPGLPYELAMECLIRVPYQFHSAMRSVSRSWRSSLSDSSFARERRRCGKTELLLCFVQPLLPQNKAVEAGEEKLEVDEPKQKRVSRIPPFVLNVYNAATATWNHVAFSHERLQMPLFCECVVLQGKILLIGGLDPETLRPARDVYILEIAGRRWRRGAAMKESRSFFACASVGSTRVYVAGGHDDDKNALRSAEVYDVEKDEWTKIPPMTEGRDECQGFAVGTDLGFCVLSGYASESQGRFRSDGEIYELATNSWSKIENLWPFPGTSLKGNVAGDFRGSSYRLWCFTGGESQRRWESKDELGKWKVEVETVKLPIKGGSVFAGSLGDEAMVMVSSGRSRECEDEEGAMMMMMKRMEVNNGRWSCIHTPDVFSTSPFSHASIYV